MKRKVKLLENAEKLVPALKRIKRRTTEVVGFASHKTAKENHSGRVGLQHEER